MLRLTVLLACGTLAAAVSAGAAGPAGTTADEIAGGIVTDQTITPGGQDFYQGFAAMWHDKSLAGRFSLAVREQPSARMGNRILIDYANRTVFEAVLPPARGGIRALSESAVEIAYQNVSNAEVQRLLLRDQDLARDEF